MSAKIDITINGVTIEVEIDGEAPEPSNGLQGGYNIIGLIAPTEHGECDVWSFIGDIPGVEEKIVAAIEREAEKRREP